MKKLLSLVLTVSLLLACVPSCALAAEQSEYVQPIYTVDYAIIAMLQGGLSLKDGVFHMSGTVTSGGRASHALVTITLQKKPASGSWTNVKSWSGSGTSSAIKTATYTAQSGVFYRLKVYGYVSTASGTESDTLYTASKVL